MTLPLALELLASPPPADLPGLAAMTFPVYRPMLALAPTTRHPEQGDSRRVQPLGVVARVRGETVGLALGEVPLDGGSEPEMLSLFVAPEMRGRGLGTLLVARLEQEVAGRGFDRIMTTYTRGKPAIEAVERILWKRAWEAPQPRTISVRFPPAAALASELFSERRMTALAGGIEPFAWSDLTAAERAEIRASHARSPWITPALAHWRYEAGGFDPVSSLGARFGGAVVGWIINHQVSPGTVRFTCAFLRKDLSRRSRIVPLFRESLRRMEAAGAERATFVTPVIYPNMLRFIQRWIAPIAEFIGETRGSRKRLGGASPPAAP